MGEAEMQRIGGWIANVLDDPESAAVAAAVGREVSELGREFPIYEAFRREHLAAGV
jgi:glycine/serine hydroxymethyltransferase